MDIRAPLPRGWRTASGLIGWLALLLSTVLALTLALRPDHRDALRHADRLFSAGRYHEALAILTPLTPTLPEARARLGMLRALRGEHAQAERQLRAAMLRGLGPVEYQRALLYLGRTLADSGRHDLAARTWALVEDCRSVEACVYRGPARVLAADEALRRGEYLLASAGLQAALAGPLPPLWAESAHYRMTLLRASSAPEAARQDLTLAVTPERADPLIAPLLPAVGDGPRRLQAALDAPPAERPQLLGVFYLSLGLYGLAEEQFAQVDPHSPDALGAAAYAAYTRWRAGDASGGLQRLQALVEAHPDDPRARTLLALTYLTTNASDAAQNELDTVARLRPDDPGVALAWASWHAARREYDQASRAYMRALALAPDAERGRYALLAAKFHLATTFELCETGLTFAEAAAAAAPDDAEALTLLAAHRYHCGQFAGAAEAAHTAQQTGGGPDAFYYLGAALAALGDGERARSALIHAADLAPASDWRRRAELVLGMLPLYASSK
ncbi:MAG: tetratricopeptide repeat protein [Chloroflexaceae bacterium]